MHDWLLVLLGAVAMRELVSRGGQPARRRGGRANAGAGDVESAGPFRLVEVRGINNPVLLRNDAAEALLRMIEAARRDGIRSPLLMPFDGYRTEEQQARRHAGKSAKWVAHADSSEHRTGRGVDLWLGDGSAHTDEATIRRLRTTRAWKWLDRNAARYGFYPYKVEPWHWAFGQPHITDREVLRAEVQRGREEGYLT